MQLKYFCGNLRKVRRGEVRPKTVTGKEKMNCEGREEEREGGHGWMDGWQEEARVTESVEGGRGVQIWWKMREGVLKGND